MPFRTHAAFRYLTFSVGANCTSVASSNLCSPLNDCLPVDRQGCFNKRTALLCSRRRVRAQLQPKIVCSQLSQKRLQENLQMTRLRAAVVGRPVTAVAALFYKNLFHCHKTTLLQLHSAPRLHNPPATIPKRIDRGFRSPAVKLCVCLRLTYAARCTLLPRVCTQT